MTNYVTPDITRHIGEEGELVVASEPVELGAIRRFTQAIMDDDPIYWDADAARRAGYEGVVAPPLFPLHAVRRRPGTPDPLEALIEDPDADGGGRAGGGAEGLSPLNIVLPRLLNGGNDVEIYDLARVGDVIARRSRYADIYEKTGRSGPLVFVITETDYFAHNRGVLLLRSRQTHIRR
jgi:hypothetical protein